MTYLTTIRGYYYFNRRVPEYARDYDPRPIIRISLKTDSRQIAKQRAALFNSQLEAYWAELIKTATPHDNSKFSKTVKIARRMGFTYQPMSIVADLPIAELVERLLALKDASLNQIDAVLGGQPSPAISIKESLERYWSYSKDKLLNKSTDQVRKWKNPRIRAINNFVAAVGNKELVTISREDVLSFRDWWLGRIDKDHMNPDTANKDFIHLKSIMEAVSDNLQLQLDVAGLFKKIKIKSRHKQNRPPFSREDIRKILASPTLSLLKADEKWFIYAAAGTGARPSEIVGLLPEDIHLNAPIPYISIKDRKERELKTPHSERDIPLIGTALEAFRHMPTGFQRYRAQPDRLTNIINKFLRKHGLLPTARHSLYSFRHSFQDMLLAVDTPDRVQAELMGHKFNRPKYGHGATLEHKRQWLSKSLET